MKRRWQCLVALLFHGIYLFAQQADFSGARIDSSQPLSISAQKNNSWKSLAFPSLLVLYGFTNLRHDGPFGFNLHTHSESALKGSTWHTNLENYFQYSPALSVYALDAAGVKAKHGFMQRSKILALGIAFAGISTYTFKRSINVERPNKTNFRSFPSGHTAFAFNGADFFYTEFKAHKKWWIYSGYIAAATVGILRMVNYQHWLSDITAGAGFGILSNRLSNMIFKKSAE